jgi:radical SAM superfamily enzyme
VRPILYTSGPISADDEATKAANIAAFREAEAALRAAGYTVVSPLDNGLPAESTWAQHMRADIVLMMGCDAVALLPGWVQSRGARVEARLAESLEMRVSLVEAWLTIAQRKAA